MHELRYEHVVGGRVREVRLNITLPAVELNVAVDGLAKVSVPAWKGFPQPGGGFPFPSDSILVERQKVPRIFAHSIPQCVYSSYGFPACELIGVALAVALAGIELEPQPANATVKPKIRRAPSRIHPHYVRRTRSSHRHRRNDRAAFVASERPGAASSWHCACGPRASRTRKAIVTAHSALDSGI